jgi:hypothetical protein
VRLAKGAVLAAAVSAPASVTAERQTSGTRAHPTPRPKEPSAWHSGVSLPGPLGLKPGSQVMTKVWLKRTSPLGETEPSTGGR